MKNRGMALVTGLLMLTAMALLAVTAAGSMTLQQHQAANFADKRLASERAALAESWALAWLYSRTAHERGSACVTGCILPLAVHAPGALPDRPELESPGWWRETAVASATEPASGEPVGFSTAAPYDSYWLIQETHFEPSDLHEGIDGVGYYRVFGRGSGVAPGSTAVAEAIVARPWGTAVQALDFPPAGSLASFCSALPRALPCGIVAWRNRR